MRNDYYHQYHCSPFPKSPFFLNNVLDQRIVQNNGITLSSQNFNNNESLVTPGQHYESSVALGQCCLCLPSSPPPRTCSCSSSSRPHLPGIGNVPRWESKPTNSICCSIDHKYFFKTLKSFTCIIYVGLIVTGGNAMDRRKNVEVFPEKLDCPLPPQLPDPGELSPRQVPCLTYFLKWAWGRNGLGTLTKHLIRPIFQGRYRHSLSLIKDSLVVCGGKGTEKSCISWKQGQTSWEDFHTLRSVVTTAMPIICPFFATKWAPEIFWWGKVGHGKFVGGKLGDKHFLEAK